MHLRTGKFLKTENTRGRRLLVRRADRQHRPEKQRGGSFSDCGEALPAGHELADRSTAVGQEGVVGVAEDYGRCNQLSSLQMQTSTFNLTRCPNWSKALQWTLGT